MSCAPFLSVNSVSELLLPMVSPMVWVRPPTVDREPNLISKFSLVFPMPSPRRLMPFGHVRSAWV